MGLLRLVGPIKSKVSFAEYYLFYRALLQKKTYNFIDPTNRSHTIYEDEKMPRIDIKGLK